jgi:uncharacterized delta-60 repeat protein
MIGSREASVIGVFRVVRWAGIVAIVVVAGCSRDSESTEPEPASGPPTVSRLWQVFVADRHANWTELGDDRTQNDGIAYDSVGFGNLAVVPRFGMLAAEAVIFSNETGQTYRVSTNAPHLGLPSSNVFTGDMAQLYQESRYVVDSENPALIFTLTGLTLATIDGDARAPTAAQCRQNPPGDPVQCPSIRAVSRFRLVARNGTDQLLSVQGSVRVQGHSGVWDFDVWTEDGDAPAFTRGDFFFDPDFDDSDTFSFAQAFLDAANGTGGCCENPIHYPIPLDGAKRGDTIVVNVAVTALALDSRQAETYAGVFLRDPATSSGVTVEANGLHLVAPPHPPTAEEIKSPAQPAAACSGSAGSGGTLQFASSEFATAEGEFPGALVEVTRTGSTTGVVSAVVSTSGGSAASGGDYDAVTAVVRFGDGQGGSRMIVVPIHGDATTESDETIGLTLSSAGGCATLGGPTSATLTIHDDDAPVTPPAQFSIGGTVSGLAGSGLALRDRIGGEEARPTTNGTFTIVSAALDGRAYAVEVATQPSNPLQICTVANGTGTITSASVSNITVTCTTPAATGSLDAGFGSAGRVTAALTGGATAMALQPDGKIVVGGASAIQRFNGDGSLDTSFGAGGQADFTFPNTLENLPRAIAVQADGKIVVVGQTTQAARSDFVVARYTAAGTLDATFGAGGDGKLIIDFGGLSARGTGVALQSDGSIVVGGRADLGSISLADADFAAARLTTAGALDPSFGTNGKTTINVGGKFDEARAIALASDGKIVLAGHAGVDGGSNGNVGLVRLTTDGVVDPTFGTNGVVNSPLGLGDVTREAFGLAIQPDDRIIITGEVQVAGVLDVLVARFTADGALDPSFGTNGVTTTAFTSQGDAGKAVALQADGRIVVAGRTALFGSSDFGLARYSADGTPDPAFGNGQLVVDFLSGNDGAESVVVQPDGKIVVAGFARNGNSIGLGMVRVIP